MCVKAVQLLLYWQALSQTRLVGLHHGKSGKPKQYLGTNAIYPKDEAYILDLFGTFWKSDPYPLIPIGPWLSEDS